VKKDNHGQQNEKNTEKKKKKDMFSFIHSELIIIHHFTLCVLLFIFFIPFHTSQQVVFLGAADIDIRYLLTSQHTRLQKTADCFRYIHM